MGGVQVDRTLVIAHRTCPLGAPENSLEGVRLAASVGADYVEIDIRRTSDGVPVLMHDPLLGRTTGRWWPVRATSSRRMREVRLRANGERVPSLADVLEQLPDGLGLAVDIKDAGAAPAVLAEVRRRNATDRVLLWSQRGRAVRYLAQAADGIEVALLRDTHDAAGDQRFLHDAVRWGARAISVHEGSLARDLPCRAHARGLRVYTWFQDLARQRGGVTSGLDGVVTDWVAEARRELA